MTSLTKELPTTQSQFAVPNMSLERLTFEKHKLHFASQPFYGTIAQATTFCRETNDFHVPFPDHLLSLIFAAYDDNGKTPALALIKEHMTYSGHFLSAFHTFEHTYRDKRWFQLTPKPEYAGESYTSPKEFKGIGGIRIIPGADPVDLLDGYVLDKQSRFDLFFGIKGATSKPVKLRTPYEEPYRVNPHGIVSIQASLTEIYFSLITDPAATGIVPLLINSEENKKLAAGRK